MPRTDPRRNRLEAAVNQHLAGRLDEAISAYEALLRTHGADADILQRLGVALAQFGRPEAAVECLAHSLQIQPDRPAVIFNLARALHDARRHEDALHCCDQLLAPGAGPQVYRLRGAILTALGRAEESLAAFGQAVRLAPEDAGALCDLGVALESGGRPDDALACFERALELDPRLVPAYHNAALLRARKADYQRALGYYDKALLLQPRDAGLHLNRGNALRALGQLDEAIKSYDAALALEPRAPDALHNRAAVRMLLGRYTAALEDYDLLASLREQALPVELVGRAAALNELGRSAEALRSLEKALSSSPDDAAAYVQHGVALQRLSRQSEAVASFERALVLAPVDPDVLNNLGVALAALGRHQQALDAFLRSLVFKVSNADTHTNVGIMLKALHRFEDAKASFERALWHKPDDPAASLELAFLHLTRGEFEAGWPLYESRFRVAALGAPARSFAAPRWRGEDLAGRTILVHAEQGLGDAIQFCRYLPLLAERGAQVLFEVVPSMQALMRTLPAGISVVGRGEPLPPFDVHCPLLSLPLNFGTRVSTIPANVPYLAADSVRVRRWSERLQSPSGLRVGIAWQGNPSVEKLIWAQGRSFALEALRPVAALDGVQLVSLQKGAGVEQLRSCTFRDRIFVPGTEIDPGPDAFVDTAALMMSLDLVITSDTSIAHLAGALGRPVWVVLGANPDWRWLLDRGDSPWYPAMRLFRSAGTGWDAVMASLATSLGQLLAARAT